MKLQTKIIVILILSLLLLTVSFIIFSRLDLRRDTEEYLEDYMNLVLSNYIDEYPNRLHALLKKNGLDIIPSFVESYQKEAADGAARSRIERDGYLFTVTGEEHEQLDSKEKMVHDKTAGEYYLGEYFEPWDWYIFIAVSDTDVEAHIRRSTLQLILIAAIWMGVSFVIVFLMLKYFLVIPVVTLDSSAKKIAAGEAIGAIEIGTSDELGTLARSMESMAQTIRHNEEELKQANLLLENKVRMRTQRLAEINKELKAEITVRKETETRLSQSLEEKEILMREIHHRIKNNLNVIYSLLEFQKEYSDKKNPKDQFSAIQHRVEAMALIHQKLYRADNLSHIRVDEYIESLIDQLQASMINPEKYILCETHLESISLPIEQILPIGLILNELYTNSIKYAFPDSKEGTIEVTLSTLENGSLMFTYSDNGVGMPQGGDQTSGLGLFLVEAMGEQLEAEVTVDGSRGLRYEMIFQV